MGRDTMAYHTMDETSTAPISPFQFWLIAKAMSTVMVAAHRNQGWQLFVVI